MKFSDFFWFAFGFLLFAFCFLLFAFCFFLFPLGTLPGRRSICLWFPLLLLLRFRLEGGCELPGRRSTCFWFPLLLLLRFRFGKAGVRYSAGALLVFGFRLCFCFAFVLLGGGLALPGRHSTRIWLPLLLLLRFRFGWLQVVMSRRRRSLAQDVRAPA